MDDAPVVREADFGVDGFLTAAPGIGGRLKVRHEDFRVEELGPPPREEPDGRLTAALVRLTNWETNRFVRDASGRLGISRRGIHFAGNKDKRAVTTQWFTVRAAPADVEAALGSMPGVRVLRTHRTRRERTLGDHQGNRFEVVVRDVALDAQEATARVDAIRRELADAGGFPNFYGPQRFGSLRPTTHLVGRQLVQGQFAEAITTYVATPSPEDGPDVAQARQVYRETGDPAQALNALERSGADFERALLNALIQRPDKPARAFDALPRNLQTLFVFAYQSYLFNRILSRRLSQGLPLMAPAVGDLVVPIEHGNPRDEFLPVGEGNLERVGIEAARGRLLPTGLLCGTEAPIAAGAPGRIERAVLEDDRVGPSDFVVPESRRLSSKGNRRPLGVAAPDLEAAVESDGDGGSVVRLAFDLPKGVYATVLLREFLKTDAVRAYG